MSPEGTAVTSCIVSRCNHDVRWVVFRIKLAQILNDFLPLTDAQRHVHKLAAQLPLCLFRNSLDCGNKLGAGGWRWLTSC